MRNIFREATYCLFGQQLHGCVIFLLHMMKVPVNPYISILNIAILQYFSISIFQ